MRVDCPELVEGLSPALSKVMEQVRHEGRPAGLMIRADASAGFAVEVFVEQH